ncbi:GIY-YIG nuclease family protein [Priestia aryabhattai]|uniref:GIY-YIG nuclease family protein n=1 Tax=Priestia aryabhattai TaxID=412384 RepID=UPI003680E052
MGHDRRENWYGFLLNPYQNIECVYALYDKKDNLLYIGQTMDFKTRMIGHLSGKPYSHLIEMIVFYKLEWLNRKQVEFIMIDLCKPKFNNQNQDLFMKSKRYEIIKNRYLPEYDCKCSVCKPSGKRRLY